MFSPELPYKVTPGAPGRLTVKGAGLKLPMFNFGTGRCPHDSCTMYLSLSHQMHAYGHQHFDLCMVLLLDGCQLCVLYRVISMPEKSSNVHGTFFTSMRHCFPHEYWPQ